MKLLIVEDDKETAAYLKRALSEVGHVVDAAAGGRSGLMLAAGEPYDVIILDRMLPEIDGLGILRTIRASGVKTPVLVLTALGGIDDRVEGLEAGGDDYLVKPFHFSERLARVTSLARRPAGNEQPVRLVVHDLELDLLSHTARRAGVTIDLQAKEFTLLEVLMRNAGRIITKTMLLEQVWDFNFDPKTTVVETHMSRLRAKVDKPFDVALIHTTRNSGYSIHAPR